MKPLLVLFLGLLLFAGCGNKNTVEVIPDYNSIYLSSDNVDRGPKLLEGNENKLAEKIKAEMTKDSIAKINLDYKLLLDKKGNVEKIQTINTAGGNFTNIVALEAGGWKFEPAYKDGHPVKSQYNWEFKVPPAGKINEKDYRVEADTMPSPVGGIYALQKNIVYPEKAKQKGIEGKVIVQAYINEQGEVVKTEVLKSAGAELDKAAMNAVEGLKFTPGKANGKPVKVRVVIPIIFKLS